MFTLSLQWKEFNLNLQSVKEWIDANLDAECVGLSAHSKLEAHFTDEPSEQDKSDLQAYWNGLTDQSDEATSYQTAEQIKAAADADRAAKLASARTKLEGLGLTAEEVSAILGQ